MKIRIMGSKDECSVMRALFLSQRQNKNVLSVEVSELYANRPPSEQYRLYVDIFYDKNIDFSSCDTDTIFLQNKNLSVIDKKGKEV